MPELPIALACLAVALALRPWRMLREGGAPRRLLTPLLATLVLLPWVWALPALRTLPLPMQWSGACLVLLMLGWPLAVPVLLAVGGIAALVAPIAPMQALQLAVWHGLVPATLALGLGALLRRAFGTHPFVYVLGRAFLGTVLCVFAAALLRGWLSAPAPGARALGTVGLWLMAWADGVVTGMLAAIFVAYRPQWLATWSDALYLKR